MKLECFEVWIRGSRTGLEGEISKMQGRAGTRTLTEHGHVRWLSLCGFQAAFQQGAHRCEHTAAAEAPPRPAGARPAFHGVSCAGRRPPRALTRQLSGCELSWKTQTRFDDPVHWVRLTKSHPVLLLSILHCTLVWLGSREPSRKLFCIKLYPPIHMLKL